MRSRDGCGRDMTHLRLGGSVIFVFLSGKCNSDIYLSGFKSSKLNYISIGQSCIISALEVITAIIFTFRDRMFNFNMLGII